MGLKIYLDTCIFISYFKKEERTPEEMEGVENIFHQIDSKKATLVTSTLLLTEFLPCTMPLGTDERFFRIVMNKKNVSFLPVDMFIALQANKIREFYKNMGRCPSTPDAIHLATALYGKCDTFYTFDQGKKDGFSLLNLEGTVAGQRLTICKPYSDQRHLSF